MLAVHKIYLASKSPRRRELLHQAGIKFELLLLRDAPPRGPDVTEIVLENELPLNYVNRVTKEKAQAAWNAIEQRHLPLFPVLAADTSVVIGKKILGKPSNKEEAVAMMKLLSGNTHLVHTSIALQFQRHFLHHTQTSEVQFCELSEEQIQSYCDSSEPYDKAGGYGIQGMAARFISHIQGSYSGIMGLPIFETCDLLGQLQVRLSNQPNKKL